MPRQPTAVFAKTDRKCSNRTEALHHPTVAASGRQRVGPAAQRSGSRGGPPPQRAGKDIRQTRKEPLGASEIERKRLCHGFPWSMVLEADQ